MTTAKQAARILQNLEERVSRIERGSRIIDALPTKVQSARGKIGASDSVDTPTQGPISDGMWVTTQHWSYMEWT